MKYQVSRNPAHFRFCQSRRTAEWLVRLRFSHHKNLPSTKGDGGLKMLPGGVQVFSVSNTKHLRRQEILSKTQSCHQQEPHHIPPEPGTKVHCEALQQCGVSGHSIQTHREIQSKMSHKLLAPNSHWVQGQESQRESIQSRWQKRKVVDSASTKNARAKNRFNPSTIVPAT
jgi:transcription initiation factor TFIID subunit TAF12